MRRSLRASLQSPREQTGRAARFRAVCHAAAGWRCGQPRGRFDIRIEQTLAQDALPDHARRSEENHFHLTVSSFSRRRIPERVRRPSAAREALGFSPLVHAGWADASRVEGVPLVAADAEPFVFFAGRPLAERTANTGAGCVPALLFVEFAIQHDRRLGNVSHETRSSSYAKSRF
jgi:hypothetical protein